MKKRFNWGWLWVVFTWMGCESNTYSSYRVQNLTLDTLTIEFEDESIPDGQNTILLPPSRTGNLSQQSRWGKSLEFLHPDWLGNAGITAINPEGDTCSKRGFSRSDWEWTTEEDRRVVMHTYVFSIRSSDFPD